MELSELEKLCTERNLQGHWWPEPGHNFPEPGPYLWKGADIITGLERAGELLERGGRINGKLMQPKHPDMDWGMSNTIHCTIQYFMPGERQRSHRNTGAETRFVIRGAPDAAFVVEGEAFPMEEGDFITTPSWAWHGHYNEGNAGAIWLDGMETRIALLGSQIGEEYPDGGLQPVSKPADYSLRVQGHVKPSWIKSELPTPPHRYRWADTYAALMAIKDSGSSGDPYDGLFVQYANPVTGGPTLPTRTFGLHLFTPSMHTAFHRHNCTTIYYAHRGRGTVIADGERLEWEQGDLLMIPPWSSHAHENQSKEDGILFSISDSPTLTALGLYREEAS